MRSLVPVMLVGVCSIGCPQPESLLDLAGDERVVGTWESSAEILGFRIELQSTFDVDGSYLGFLRVLDDNSTLLTRGRWYANQDTGEFDIIKESTIPDTPSGEGTTRALYKIDGDILEIWNNPINHSRPANRESAANYMLHTRVIQDTRKQDDSSDILKEIVEYVF